ncbi:PepSY-associated TM helix domain-containing protein [Pedobacter aquatilis]|uniref:PepSY-associated TM helix domain-containing protein n=1 Tax=Pedobacter aquatilis TaxID=351343 RepID=UPI002931C9F0|nr:PepSY-associated TM helix domain-containing protein [Pedobacter aquatilis]
MKNKRVRKVVNQIHLWLGLITGIIVFVISITGFAYVFEEEIRDFNDRQYLEVPAQQTPFVGLGTIIDHFQAHAKEKLGSVKLTPGKSNATIQLVTNKKKTYYFNPYSGEKIYARKADWLNTVLELHTSLLMGETGKMIQGWSVVIFLIILVSGLVLWFPSQRRLLKQSLKIKWGASFKRVNFDLHQVLGFYASIFLIVIALSGTYFTFSGVKKTVAFITGSKLSEGIKNKQQENLQLATLSQRYDFIYNRLSADMKGAESATFSVRKNGELRVRIIYPYRFSRRQNTFFFDEPTGKLIRSKLYQNNSAADWYEATNYDLHTGRLLGYLSKIIWSLASLIGASLPVTGFIIWWKKRKF